MEIVFTGEERVPSAPRMRMGLELKRFSVAAFRVLETTLNYEFSSLNYSFNLVDGNLIRMQYRN